jgi:hypothetical protein
MQTASFGGNSSDCLDLHYYKKYRYHGLVGMKNIKEIYGGKYIGPEPSSL